MDYLPSNSSLSKQRAENTPAKVEHKRGVQKVASGKIVTEHKESVGKKMLKAIVHMDDVEDIQNYILVDVVAPSISRTIFDACYNVLSKLFGGGGRGGNTNAPYVSYRNSYDDRRVVNDRPSSQPDQRRAQRTVFNTADVVLDSRGDGEEILYRMAEVIGNYGSVTVADFCEFAGVDSQYTDNRYGWTDLRCGDGPAYVERTPHGYVIRINRPMVIEG